MILPREDIAELIGAGWLEVVVEKTPNRDRVHRVQLRPGVPAACEARILDEWPHRDGGTVIALGLVKRLKTDIKPRVRSRRERIRLMKPRGGDTADARSAMRNADAERVEDTTGVPHPNLVDAEPELVSQATEDHFARLAHKADNLRELDQCRRDLTERLDRTLEGAERLGVDPTRHVAAIERRITDLEKKLKKAA